MRAAFLLLALAAALGAQNPVPGPIVAFAPGIPTAPAPVVNTGGTDAICALHADTITGLTCNNAVTDGNTETAFTSTLVIPANSFTSGRTLRILIPTQAISTAGPTLTLKVRLTSVSGTTLLTSGANSISATLVGTLMSTIEITSLGAVGASTPLLANLGNTIMGSTITRNSLITGSTHSVTADTTAAITVVLTATWSAATAGNAFVIYGMIPQWIN